MEIRFKYNLPPVISELPEGEDLQALKRVLDNFDHLTAIQLYDIPGNFHKIRMDSVAEIILTAGEVAKIRESDSGEPETEKTSKRGTVPLSSRVRTLPFSLTEDED